VYFNPAKTTGGMVEADTYFLMGLIFASFVSLSSMDGFWFFEMQSGYEWLADTIVILWVGVSMSLAAWMKQWMGESPEPGPQKQMLTFILSEAYIQPRYLQSLGPLNNRLTHENSLQYVRNHSLFRVRK
jgi:hypothetical protein